MENLKLHKTGRIDYIKSLKEKYSLLREKIQLDKSLLASEREKELKRIEKEFQEQNKSINYRLF